LGGRATSLLHRQSDEGGAAGGKGARYRHAHFRRRSGRRRAIGYFTGSSSSPSRPGRGARSNSPARTTARRCSRLWPCGGTRCGSRPSIWRGGRPVARLLGGAASAAAAAAAPQVNVFALSARTRNTTFCTFVACSTHLWGRDRTPLPEWPRSERGAGRTIGRKSADALRPAARALFVAGPPLATSRTLRFLRGSDQYWAGIGCSGRPLGGGSRSAVTSLPKKF
jgi:hypothetical protein